MAEYIVTYSGRQFYPLAPRAEDLSIIDIAHALSLKCRWTGHTSRFYSVAEHSLLVAKHCPAKHQLWGLLHDAAEAYLPDICRPIKPRCQELVEAEQKILACVAVAFGLPTIAPPPAVVHVDDWMLAAEAVALMPSNPGLQYLHAQYHADTREMPSQLRRVRHRWPEVVEKEFLRTFDALRAGCEL